MTPRGGRCLVALAALAAACPALADEELRNWFDDPFFQISAALPDCPLPAGPFITEAQKRAEAHHRAERGTTCWLVRECDRPNSYAYDADIAAAFQAAMHERNPFPDTTLWVTAQGRVLYIEGCVARESQVAELESFARGRTCSRPSPSFEPSRRRASRTSCETLDSFDRLNSSSKVIGRVFALHFNDVVDITQAVLPSMIRREVAADEVAQIVAWLCSDASRFNTGAVFDMSGGRARY